MAPWSAASSVCRWLCRCLRKMSTSDNHPIRRSDVNVAERSAQFQQRAVAPVVSEVQPLSGRFGLKRRLLDGNGDMVVTTSATHGQAGEGGSHDGCRYFPRRARSRRCSGSGCSQSLLRHNHHPTGAAGEAEERHNLARRRSLPRHILHRPRCGRQVRCLVGSHSDRTSIACRRRSEDRCSLPPCTGVGPA